MDNLHEEWRPISGFPGYSISSHGRVHGPSGRYLFQGKRPDGYRTVVLFREGKRYTRYVHRLVAAAHVPGEGEVVRHMNHEKGDNRADNLAWGSHADNIADNVRDKRHAYGEAAGKRGLTDEAVRAIHADPRPYTEIAAAYGVCADTVGLVKRGRIWRHLLGPSWEPVSQRPRGARHPNSRLTEDDVRAIRGDTRPPPAVWKEYGISKATYYRIMNRQTWGHVK